MSPIFRNPASIEVIPPTPVLICAPNVVEHLLQRGHRSSAVMEVVEESIAPLYQTLQRCPKDNTLHIMEPDCRGTFHLLCTDLEDAIRTTNKLLYGVENGSIAIGSQRYRVLLWRIVVQLRAYFRLRPDLIERYSGSGTTLLVRVPHDDNVEKMAFYLIKAVFEGLEKGNQNAFTMFGECAAQYCLRIGYCLLPHHKTFASSQEEFAEVKRIAARRMGPVAAFVLYLRLLSKWLREDPILIPSGNYVSSSGRSHLAVDR
jgi:hypothetical protein